MKSVTCYPFFLQCLKIKYFFKFEQLAIANFLSPGFQVCTTNGGESLTAVPSEQLLENYQPDTALIEEGLY